MNQKEWLQKKHELGRHIFFELQYLSLKCIPKEKLSEYIDHIRNQSAKKIQSVWRGYHCRKLLQSQLPELRKNKAAITIQRTVREWLYRKKHIDAGLYKNTTHQIPESKLEQLENEIKQWNDSHSDTDFKYNAQTLQEHFQETQIKLNSFYNHLHENKIREQRCEALCTQIEAIFSLLQNIPSLNTKDYEIDYSIFECPLISDATQARIAHKKAMKIVNAPWWKKSEYNMQNETDF